MGFVADTQSATPKRGRFVPDAAPPAAPPAEPGILDKVKSFLSNDPTVGGAELLAHGVEGALARIPAGIAGLGHEATNALHLTTGEPADTVRKVENALTYQPQSAAAQGAMQFAGEKLAPVASAVNAGLERVGGPAAAVGVPALADAALSVTPLVEAGIAARAASVAAKEAGRPLPFLPENPVEGAAKPSDATPLQTARAAGYQARPSDVAARNPTESTPILGRVAEAVAGSGNAKHKLVAQNQPISTALIGEDIGLPNAKKITLPDLERAKAAPSAQYTATGKALGDFTPSPKLGEDLNALAQQEDLSPTARSNINQLSIGVSNGNKLNGAQLMNRISMLREAKGGRVVANALEDEIGRQLEASGNPQGLADYLNARKQFAKIYTAQDSLQGGQVNAAHYGRLLRDYPNLLTGNARIVGTAANELPEVTGLPVAGSSNGDWLGKLIGIAHSVTGAKWLGNKLLGSDAVQNAFGRVMTPAEASYAPTFGVRPPRRGLGDDLAQSPPP